MTYNPSGQGLSLVICRAGCDLSYAVCNSFESINIKHPLQISSARFASGQHTTWILLDI